MQSSIEETVSQLEQQHGVLFVRACMALGEGSGLLHHIANMARKPRWISRAHPAKMRMVMTECQDWFEDWLEDGLVEEGCCMTSQYSREALSWDVLPTNPISSKMNGRVT